MAGRIVGDNKHLEALTSAKWVHLDGSVTTPVTIRATAGRLQKVILNTNGATITLRNGSEVIGIIAADAPEGPFPYGIFCNTSIIATCSGAVDATVVFED